MKYLQEENKAKYINGYEVQLAKRLLKNQTWGLPFEKKMVDIIRKVLGQERIYKLRCMLENMSEDLSLEFVDSRSEPLGIDFSAVVLRSVVWPLERTTVCFNVPEVLCRPLVLFEQFYSEKFTQRKLTWYHEVSSVEVELTYLDKPYVITMGVSHLAVLLLFNDCDTLNFRKVQDATNLPEKALVKVFKALVKEKLLTGPINGACCSASVFTINLAFSSPDAVLKTPQLEFSKEEEQQNDDKIQARPDTTAADQDHYLRCVTTRIMKRERELGHTELVDEVVKQASERFLPTEKQIKHSIGKVIDLGCMDYVPDAADVYCYVP